MQLHRNTQTHAHETRKYIPLQIGDPIVVGPGEYVRNKYRHPGFAIADTVAKEDVRTWIAGKQYTSLSKTHPGRINLWDVHQGMEKVYASQKVSRHP